MIPRNQGIVANVDADEGQVGLRQALGGCADLAQQLFEISRRAADEAEDLCRSPFTVEAGSEGLVALRQYVFELLYPCT